MEKLDLLAQRIDSLIQELVRLREENHHLREELELGQMTSEDLQEQLNRERAVRDEACSRVDDLINRIQASFPAVEPQQNNQ